MNQWLNKTTKRRWEMLRGGLSTNIEVTSRVKVSNVESMCCVSNGCLYAYCLLLCFTLFSPLVLSSPLLTCSLAVLFLSSPTLFSPLLVLNPKHTTHSPMQITPHPLSSTLLHNVQITHQQTTQKREENKKEK